MIEGKATGHALHYEPFMHDELVLVTSASNSAFRDDEVDMATLGRLPSSSGRTVPERWTSSRKPSPAAVWNCNP